MRQTVPGIMNVVLLKCCGSLSFPFAFLRLLASGLYKQEIAIWCVLFGIRTAAVTTVVAITSTAAAVAAVLMQVFFLLFFLFLSLSVSLPYSLLSHLLSLSLSPPPLPFTHTHPALPPPPPLLSLSLSHLLSLPVSYSLCFTATCIYCVLCWQLLYWYNG